jgi:colicin import membrane protein
LIKSWDVTIAQKRPFVRNMEARPTPESTFISTARENLVTPGTSSQAESSTIRQGELAKRLLAMQQEKNKAMEDMKIAILEAKYTSRIKKAEEAAAKRLEQEQRKAEQAAARAAEIAQKKEEKRQDAENKKKAKAETRRIIAKVRKELADKKKREAAEKKQAEKEKKDLKRAKLNAAKRATLQQEAKDRAQLLATLRAAKDSDQQSDDSSDFVSQPTQKIRMLDELRNTEDL